MAQRTVARYSTKAIRQNYFNAHVGNESRFETCWYFDESVEYKKPHLVSILVVVRRWRELSELPHFAIKILPVSFEIHTKWQVHWLPRLFPKDHKMPKLVLLQLLIQLLLHRMHVMDDDDDDGGRKLDAVDEDETPFSL